MRESNFASPAQNRAAVCISSQIYDRRAHLGCSYGGCFFGPTSLGVSSPFSKHVCQCYEPYFWRVNQHLAAANHLLVLLDVPGIVDEDYTCAGHGTSFEEWIPLRDGAIEFVKGVAAEEQPGSNILFSHIPLHRAESKQCGTLQKRRTIHRGVGHGWQKTLGKQTSAFLLESLRPAIVFSADDRDYYDVTHALDTNSPLSPFNSLID